VISGTRFWEQEFGVPHTGTNNAEPEVRKYILTQATLSRRKKLYVRVTDASESKTFSVFALGPMISFSNPQMRVDQGSKLHVFYQDGAHSFSYNVVSPDGEQLVRQTYFNEVSPPRMKVAENGEVVITGGVRHYAANDLPFSKKSFSTNDIPPPVP
jgi:hypothetical protein